MSTFQRPASLKFPSIFYTFKAKDKNSENIVEYRVQDLPTERFGEALDLLVKHFLPDEALNICRGLMNSPAGVEEHRQLWAEMLKLRLTIACFKGDELVGVNVMAVNSKDDPKDELNVS